MNAICCQSCGMPMIKEEIFGREKDGRKSEDYCVNCYQEGYFTQPDFTLENMIEFCIPFLKEDGKNDEEARQILCAFLPTLKRWRGDIKMDPPKFKKKEMFQIIGISDKTSNANEMTANAQIPQMWQKFYEQKIFEQLAVDEDGMITYGLYSDYVNGVHGEYDITIGIKESGSGLLLDGLTVKTVPAANYAVFTTEKGQVGEVVGKAWQYIWSWFNASEIERAYLGDFEVYDERCANPNECQVDIYVSIKDKHH